MIINFSKFEADAENDHGDKFWVPFTAYVISHMRRCLNGLYHKGRRLFWRTAQFSLIVYLLVNKQKLKLAENRNLSINGACT